MPNAKRRSVFRATWGLGLAAIAVAVTGCSPSAPATESVAPEAAAPAVNPGATAPCDVLDAAVAAEILGVSATEAFPTQSDLDDGPSCIYVDYETEAGISLYFPADATEAEDRRDLARADSLCAYRQAQVPGADEAALCPGASPVAFASVDGLYTEVWLLTAPGTSIEDAESMAIGLAAAAISALAGDA